MGHRNNGSRFTSFVIKPLPHALRGLPGYAVATLIGDGRLDLVISLRNTQRVIDGPAWLTACWDCSSACCDDVD